MNTMENLVLPELEIQLFAETQVTTSSELSPEMKTYYSDYLIDNAVPELVHDQFGQKHPIPKGRGKKVEFRKYTPLTKALTPLTEGVTPAGNKLAVTTIEAEVHQYGDFIEISDLLILTAIDNNLVQATELLGAQAGMTMDTITREVLNGGTNVQFAEGQVSARAELAADHKLTVKAVKMAVRTLKKQNAKKIDGSFAAIIHPDVAFDLTEDPNWKYPHQYADTEELYAGEIGRVAGVRFVETTEAKIFTGTGSGSRDVGVLGGAVIRVALDGLRGVAVFVIEHREAAGGGVAPGQVRPLPHVRHGVDGPLRAPAGGLCALGHLRHQVADSRYDQEWAYQQDRDSVEDSRYDQEWQYQLSQAAQRAARTGRSGTTSPEPEKPTLTYNQVMDAIENGNLTKNVLAAYEYYMGEPYGGGAPQFSTYQDAAAYLQAQGKQSGGLMTQAEWARHKNNGNDQSGGRPSGRKRS